MFNFINFQIIIIFVLKVFKIVVYIIYYKFSVNSSQFCTFIPLETFWGLKMPFERNCSQHKDQYSNHQWY